MNLSDKNLQDSLEELKKLVSEKEDDFVGLKGKNNLVKACSVVCNAMGFELDSKSESEENLYSICRNSKMHFREILLDSNWWKQDHGHFLGIHNQEPVAMISKAGKYFMISPLKSEKIEVDEKVKEEISGVGFMLYRPAAEKLSNFRALFEVIFRKKGRDYLFLFLAGTLATLLGFFTPFANKILFDRIIPNFDYTLFVQILIGLTVALLTSTAFVFIRSLFSLRLNGHITHELQMSLWSRLLKLPVNFFRQFQTGDLIQRTLIFDRIRRSVSQSTIVSVFDSIFAILYLVVMFLYSWQLALTGIIVISITSILLVIMLTLKIHWDTKILESSAKINSFLVQMISGIEKLRVTAAEKTIYTRWLKDFTENQSYILKSKFISNIINIINSSSNQILSVLLFGIVIWMRFQSENGLTIGGYLAFMAAFGPFSAAFFGLVNTMSSFIGLIPFWKRIQPLIKTPVETTKEQQSPGDLSGKIEIKNLFFRYQKQTPFVLKEFNLSFQPGDFIGITGPSGCGKSTLSRLLVGFEIPEQGNVILDDKDLKDLDLNEVRKQIHLLSQQNAIFSGKIYENIVCGGHYSDEELDTAMELSTFDQDLKRFPAGLNMLLSSGGSLLSGGERQKLLLTRAFIRKPKILILDEGLNSLDSKSQREVFENLKSLPITKILLTHQLSILKELEQIHVMNTGVITASGNYKELLKSDSFFKKLHKAQT